MNQNFSIITAEQVSDIISNNHKKIYELIKKAYISHHNKETINPPSYFLRYSDKPNSRIIALPASITHNPRISGIKWIASNPDNINIGLNRASAVIILNDYDTGYPIACLEGSLISAIRTAYSAVLSADNLIINKKVNTLGIIGTGRIAYNIIKCLHLQGWDIDHITLHDTLENSLKSFISLLNENNIKLAEKITTEDKKENLVKKSDLLILTTTAKEPYINDSYKIKNNTVILNISLRDLSPEVLIKYNNIVDDLDHIMHANTSPHLTQQKYGNTNFINGTIGHLITNAVVIDNKKPTVVSPMGLGILDIALANFVYCESEKNQQSIKINNFFG
jgi:ornithine cyclodeaminase